MPEFTITRQSQDGGGDQAHVFDLAENGTGFHHVAHIEGTIKENHDARGKIGQRILEGKTDDETNNTQTGEHGAEGNAHMGQGDQDTNEHHNAVAHVFDHVSQQP